MFSLSDEILVLTLITHTGWKTLDVSFNPSLLFILLFKHLPLSYSKPELFRVNTDLISNTSHFIPLRSAQIAHSSIFWSLINECEWVVNAEAHTHHSTETQSADTQGIEWPFIISALSVSSRRGGWWLNLMNWGPEFNTRCTEVML